MKTSVADRILEMSMPLSLRPRKGDRARVLAAMLRNVVAELGELDLERSGDDWIVSADSLHELADELDKIAEES